MATETKWNNLLFRLLFLFYLGFCFGIAAHFLDRNIFRSGERADVVLVLVGGTDGEHFSPQDIIYKPISLHGN